MYITLLQVSACLPDEMLVQEGALRAHNLLAPLLALTDPPAEVHKALATMHIGLQGVANLVQVQHRIFSPLLCLYVEPNYLVHSQSRSSPIFQFF